MSGWTVIWDWFSVFVVRKGISVHTSEKVTEGIIFILSRFLFLMFVTGVLLLLTMELQRS